MAKKILYINQYFKPPTEPGSTRAYWNAQRLIEAGYQVTMLAHRNVLLHHVGEAPPYERKEIDGIDVIYLRNRYSNAMGLVGRARAFLSFMLRSTVYALKEKDIDLVIATSTPLTVAFPALIRKWFKGTPFIFEVRDLWPEVPIQMGGVRNPILIKFLKWFEKTTYKKAAHVVALSPGMQDGVVKYIPADKVSMIPNMAKNDKFWPREKNLEMAEGMGLRRDSFKAIYFGQMGRSNALDYIVDAAKILKQQEVDIEFLFIGHGNKRDAIQKRVDAEALTNVHIYERVAMNEMSEIVNFCDVSLVTFADIPILYTNSPNKLFDSLSAAKPIVVNSAGWTKEMVEDNDCGCFVDPSSPEDLVEKLLHLKNDPELARKQGENGRKLAQERYDKSILTQQFVAVVDAHFDRAG